MTAMTKRLDPDDLVTRAKEGRVASAEVAEVVKILTARRGGADTYDLLYVIGRSGVVSEEALVAGFLEYREDPMVARLALQTLCTFWGQTQRYLGEVERFLDGVEWDVMGDVREVAISAAGDHLGEHRHCGLLTRLLALADPASASAVERRIAVEALAHAVGEPLVSAINADKGNVTWEQWAEEVTARAQQRLAADCS